MGAEGQASPPESANPSSFTVLLVDHEVLVRMAIAAYLRDCGYTVIEAASGAEAVTVLVEGNRPVDVVLSDVEVSGPTDGFGLADWIRRHRPGLRVILAGTPGRAAEAAGELCEKGPALGRPYDPKAVVDMIRRMLSAASRD